MAKGREVIQGFKLRFKARKDYKKMDVFERRVWQCDEMERPIEKTASSHRTAGERGHVHCDLSQDHYQEKRDERAREGWRDRARVQISVLSPSLRSWKKWDQTLNPDRNMQSNLKHRAIMGPLAIMRGNSWTFVLILQHVLFQCTVRLSLTSKSCIV